jgi:hypothetical protein
MSRIIVIHHKKTTVEALIRPLEQAGYQIAYLPLQEMGQLRAACDDPPAVFIIDLNRAPSQGQSIAVWLRQQKATRGVPLVFAGGAPEKVQRVQSLLPDAVYSDWDKVGDAVQQAVQHPPEAPVVPGTMDSYAGRPLSKKLGLRPEVTVNLLGAPEGFEELVVPLPEAARLVREVQDSVAIVVLFCRSRAELEQRFPEATEVVAEGGRLWIAWPKKASGVVSDLSQNVVRAFGLAAGWVDFKISAFDQTWSGLCFVRRQ